MLDFGELSFAVFIIVFHPHCGRQLHVLLKDMYPYMIYNVGFQSWGLNSGSSFTLSILVTLNLILQLLPIGLAMLSRYPIISPKFQEHPIHDGDDRFARKVKITPPLVRHLIDIRRRGGVRKGGVGG